jgi:uncharacterized protein YbjT (DUF2867 family)
MILATGATGNVGAELVRALAGGGQQVRALIRREADRATLPAGVDAFVGDLNQPETLAGAVEGVGAIHLLSGYEGMDRLLADARRARVERVVLQSSSAVPGGDTSNAVARYHILSERAVRDSGLAWTSLQPNSFMSNTLQWIPQLRAGDVVRAPFADVPVATIDPHDVAAVSSRALTSSDHEGRSYRLSGPDSLLPADRVRVLGEVVGRELRFEGQSDVEAREEMVASMPAEYVDAFFSFFADGKLDESEVRDTVERLTGRRPRSFEQWARVHADAFR